MSEARPAIEVLVRSLERVSRVPEAEVYEAALTVFLRLVFLCAAEQRGLLWPDNPRLARRYAVSTLRYRLRTDADRHGEATLTSRFSAWPRLLTSFRTVHRGGSLFDPDRFPFLDDASVDDRTVSYLLEFACLKQTIEVEMIGQVYEELLDYTARRTTEPTLALTGPKRPAITLTELEGQRARGEAAFGTYLKDRTGCTESALTKALRGEHPTSLLRAACGDDKQLIDRVKPFAGLLRDDPFGVPIVVPAGGIYVIAGTARRSSGTHYTPRGLTEPLVRQTLEPLVYDGPTEGKPRDEWKLRPAHTLLALKVCDPATGGGAFLLETCRYLAERVLETGPGRGPIGPTVTRQLVAQHCLYGVDKDPTAVEITRLSLWLLTAAQDEPFTFLDHVVRCGDALVGAHGLDQLDNFTRHPPATAAPMFHWPLAFPEVFSRPAGGFDAVIGNPPWGQKVIGDQSNVRQFVAEAYESVAGIFDLFRPFVERAVKLLRPGGTLGLVLPDILLLKDYPATRAFLLDHLSIDRLTWHGLAFRGAVIDTVCLVGRKAPPGEEHQLIAEIDDGQQVRTNRMRQGAFRRNRGFAFNLHLTPEAQEVLDRLAAFAPLGDYFDAHEGVHSGNIRPELFVDSRVDDSCRELLFGGDEIRPYVLRWRGKYVRLGAMPGRKTRHRYANVGRPEWFERPKVLVRRTGDHVLAAADHSGRYASNNFFVVVPRTECPIDLHGLCALLNSRFMTWFFRTIEPRQGRAFAELKIKHLARFPLPIPRNKGGTRRLNELGRQRAQATDKAADLDAEIDEHVERLFAVGQDSDLVRLRQDKIGILSHGASDGEASRS